LPTVSNKAKSFHSISTWGLLLVQVWNSDPEVQGSNLATAGNSGKQKKNVSVEIFFLPEFSVGYKIHHRPPFQVQKKF
jgi:hypothetical protein